MLRLVDMLLLCIYMHKLRPKHVAMLYIVNKLTYDRDIA
jgi:hypothetical protein